MFSITSAAIEAPLLSPEEAAGGIVVFEGRVRDLNDGRLVTALEYEAHEELASKEGLRILDLALERFDIISLACVHRVGRLELGDVAIRVEVAAAHRRDAFEACEFVVDEIKRRVPIWKREHYVDGPAEWVDAGGTRQVTPESLYRRQMRLPEVGEEGQRRLADASVLVVGAGGLGCPALLYLAAAGVGRIGIVDDDRVEISNLHRQPLYGTNDVGHRKAQRAAHRVRQLSPFVVAEPLDMRLDASNAGAILADYDLVLDCCDNFETKFLLNDLCSAQGIPLVSSSIDRFEGQLMIVAPGGPCLRCLWPARPPEGCVGTCAEEGVLGVVPGVLGSMQAAEAIKHLLGMPLMEGDIVWVDIRTMETRSLRLKRNPDCPNCGSGSLPADPYGARSVDRILPGDLVVDIREPYEIVRPYPGSLLIPMGEFDPDMEAFRDRERVVLLCQRGVRSLHLTRVLEAQGYRQFLNFAGGVLRLRDGTQ